MNKIVSTLMNRDGYTKEEAEKYVKDEMKYVMKCIGNGDFTEAEDYFQDAFGLEPDYLLNTIL